VFFDTGGTAEPGNRLHGWMTNYPSYSGSDTWWNAWHHVVAVKNSGTKQIWIDGRLLVEQTDSAAWLYYDISKLYLGCGVSGGNPSLSIDGWIDDFAAYSTALSGTDIASLHSGTAPDAISAKTSLLAWWDFNDVPAISLAKTSDKVVVSFTEVLQAATNVSGPYVDLLDAKSPYTNDLTANPMRFFRTRK